MEGSEMRWLAKSGSQEPDGWSDVPSIGALEKGQAYALAVDIMESYDGFEPLVDAHCFHVEVTLATGRHWETNMTPSTSS